MSDESSKVEFFANNAILEIRYFDTPKDQLYYSWRLPESPAGELIAFWTMLKKNKKITFPLQKRTELCEFTMYTEKFIEMNHSLG